MGSELDLNPRVPTEQHAGPQLTRRYGLSKEDLIPAMGLIVDKQPNALFKVQIEGSEHIVLA